jgi:hypothetical protein
MNERELLKIISDANRVETRRELTNAEITITITVTISGPFVDGDVLADRPVHMASGVPNRVSAFPRRARQTQPPRLPWHR